MPVCIWQLLNHNNAWKQVVAFHHMLCLAVLHTPQLPLSNPVAFSFHPYIFIFENILREGVKRKINYFPKIFREGGGACYVTLWPKLVSPELNGHKIIKLDTQSHHYSSKNVSKICVLYLRDFLWKNWEISFERIEIFSLKELRDFLWNALTLSLLE